MESLQESLARVAAAIPGAFVREGMLLEWAKSTHRDGPKIKLLLPGDEDISPFEMATVRKGKMAGQRYLAVFVEIGDDEQPVESHRRDTSAVASRDPGPGETQVASKAGGSPARLPPRSTQKPPRSTQKPPRSTQKPPRPLAQVIGALCAGTAFQRFVFALNDKAPRPNELNALTDGVKQGWAAEIVRTVCGVGSRREIETGTLAAESWGRLYRAYTLYLDGLVAERTYVAALKRAGCLLRTREGHRCEGPGETHHIREHTGLALKAPWYEQIRFCQKAHNGGVRGESFHAGKEAFEARYGSQHELVLAQLDMVAAMGMEE